jgi:hypothetical protein
MTYKALLNILVFLILLVLICWKLFFYIDFKNHCYLKILPSFSGGNLTIKKAIGILKYASPNDYKNLCTYVRTIDPNYLGGGRYWTSLDPKTILVNPSWGPQLTAEIIVHETCHSMQYFQKRSFSEDECYGEGDRLIKNITVF